MSGFADATIDSAFQPIVPRKRVTSDFLSGCANGRSRMIARERLAN